MIFACVVAYTATIAFYIWTKEYFIKQYTKHMRRTYIFKNSDVTYHWTDYAAMLYPFINVSFALNNLIIGTLYKYNKTNVLRRLGA
jgi:hypothetical protein